MGKNFQVFMINKPNNKMEGYILWNVDNILLLCLNCFAEHFIEC